uniref:Uncharacterized protein n=1 Tax=Magnetococcus massalia (strain MO-1) TaxID=451514 RepID=A0A1S7LEI2_MAGMO|nr:Exported protein of unknown function [Candidatus Magnetococcus massalia]
MDWTKMRVASMVLSFALITFLSGVSVAQASNPACEKVISEAFQRADTMLNHLQGEQKRYRGKVDSKSKSHVLRTLSRQRGTIRRDKRARKYCKDADFARLNTLLTTILRNVSQMSVASKAEIQAYQKRVPKNSGAKRAHKGSKQSTLQSSRQTQQGSQLSRAAQRCQAEFSSLKRFNGQTQQRMAELKKSHRGGLPTADKKQLVSQMDAKLKQARPFVKKCGSKAKALLKQLLRTQKSLQATPTR